MGNHSKNPTMPTRVCIVEVGPRDGLQNEPIILPTETKLAFIKALVAAGLKEIEVTSFVHPKAIPQLADADVLVPQLPPVPGVQYSALVPNRKGLERALASGIKKIAVFTAASETFNRKNINMGIEESLEAFRNFVPAARSAGLSVRGYVSTSFVCPYEGDVPWERVLQVTLQLLEMGVEQVSLGDTIGAASPKDVLNTVGHWLEKISPDKIALHFHDTYGTALANVYAALQLGITTFDTSAGGLGGCPYAPGASGNLGTEDLVYMLHRMGIETGVDMMKVFEASSLVARELNRDLSSRQWKRLQGMSHR